MDEEKDPPMSKFWNEVYIEFQSDPTDFRTDKEFCKDIALDPGTLMSWKRKHRRFIYEEVSKRRKLYINELRAKNIKAIAKNLEDSFNDRKLMAQITGDLIERVETRTEIMDHETKMRRINALLENIGKKKKVWDEDTSKQEPPRVDGDAPKGADISAGGPQRPSGQDTPDS